MLARADAERDALLNRVARDLRLPTAPTQFLTANLGPPGSTVQLGLDFPGRKMELFWPDHVHRSQTGQGSYVQLRRSSADESSGVAAFNVEFPGDSLGIYPVVVHVAGDVQLLKVEAGVYPTGGGYFTAKRTGDKFMLPLESTSPAAYPADRR